MKKCSMCLESKPTTEFWRHLRWLDSWCKPCRRAWRFSYREIEREHDQQRAQKNRVMKAASVRVPGTEAGTVTSS